MNIIEEAKKYGASFTSDLISKTKEQEKLKIPSKKELMKLRNRKVKVEYNIKKLSDYIEKEQDYYTNLGCEINRNR